MRARSSRPPPPSSPPTLSASMEMPPPPSPSRSRSSSSSSERTARPAAPTPASQSMAIPQRTSRKGKERAVQAEELVDTATSPATTDKSTKPTTMNAVRNIWAIVAGRVPTDLMPSLRRPASLLPLPVAFALFYLLRALFRRRQPATVRDRLRMREGWSQWIIWWLVRSWQKTKGVIKLGTTITYI